MLFLTDHARRRKQQRALSSIQVDAALAWGDEIRQGGGRVAWFYGRRAALRAARAGVRYDFAPSFAVVTSSDGAIITAVASEDRRRLVRLAGRRLRRRGRERKVWR